MKELFVETVVPILSGAQWAESLDLNGAVRVAEYSTAGTAMTWKLGATYSPNDEWTVRTTRSRDIRAPNLNELFLGGQVNTQTVRDPFRNNENVPILRPLTGNTNLDVEKADTFGIGFVYHPVFLAGFSMSVDYYEIDIEDAISVIQQQEVIDRCFAGNQSLCGAIVRNADGMVTEVTVQPVNLLNETAEGVDLEASYRMGLGDGMLTVRGLVTHVLSRKVDDGVDAPQELAGQGSIAEWRGLSTIGYDIGRFSTQLMWRYVGEQRLSNANIECISGCPDPVGRALTVDNNTVSSRLYTDLSVGYQIPGSGNRPEMDLFFRVDNLMDLDPPVAPSLGGNTFVDTGVNPALHDVIGRTFRAGVRIHW